MNADSPENQYNICHKTVMDTSDPDIIFDENNISNHYYSFHEKAQKELLEVMDGTSHESVDVITKRKADKLQASVDRWQAAEVSINKVLESQERANAAAFVASVHKLDTACEEGRAMDKDQLQLSKRITAGLLNLTSARARAPIVVEPPS